MASGGEIRPYLTKFNNPKSSIELIQWNGDENKATLDDVLKNNKMDELKRMLLGGAPHLYSLDFRNPIFLSAFYSRNDIMEIILEIHERERTHEDEHNFGMQTAIALNETCLNNCVEIAHQLLAVDTPIIPRIHLIDAAKNGSTAVMDKILTHSGITYVDIRDGKKNTPLHHAVLRKHSHTVRYLLIKKANPNLTNDEGYNCVHMACQSADEDVLHLLVMNGGDVNARNNEGKTPALIAAENGKDGCIRILAAAGANLDQKDRQLKVPLIVAAAQGHTSTVRELVLNGASFDGNDNERYNALERAILNKKDETVATLIHLYPTEDFLKHYLPCVEVNLFRITSWGMKKTMKAILDRMVVQPNSKDSTNGIVNTKYLEVDMAKKDPDDKDYNKNKSSLLHRIACMNDENFAYHGTIRLIVDKKMEQFGNLALGIRLFSYVLFLLALAYSLIVQASYRPIQLSEYTRDAFSTLRILTELYVLLYFAFNIFTEVVEFSQIARLTKQYLKDKNELKKIEEKRAASIETNLTNSKITNENDVKTQRKRFKFPSKLNRIFLIRIFTDYFSDAFNYLDLVGLGTLLILILLRLSSSPGQWIFAAITFHINGLRLCKFVILIRDLGPYTGVIFQILKKDVPLFSSLFFISLCIFTGSFFIALRTPYSTAGFTNASLMADNDRISGVDNEIQWVFLSGFRILLEGNVYEGQYLYRQLNWLAATFYFIFLFLVIIVYSNLFIAQLSDTYGERKRNAKKIFALQRLNFILQIQRTSLLSLFIDYRKKYFTKEIPIGKEELLKYYGVSSIKSLNTNNTNEGIDVNEMFASIKNQQVVQERNLQEQRQMLLALHRELHLK